MKMKSLLTLVWNTLVFSVYATLCAWAMLFMFTTGMSSIGTSLLIVLIAIVVFIVFTIGLSHKTEFPWKLTRKSAESIGAVTVVVGYALTFTIYLNGVAPAVVTDYKYDLLLQSIPYGIGQAFTAMAYAEAGDVETQVLVVDLLSRLLPVHIASVILVIVGSAIRSLPQSYKMEVPSAKA